MLKDKVRKAPGGTGALSCFFCGSCTAGCPVNKIDEAFDPRKIMRMLSLDRKDVLSSAELWKCSQCHVCVAHCPQDVRFADVLRVLRDLAVTEGIVPASLLDDVEKVNAEFQKKRLEKIKELSQKTIKDGEA